MMPGNPKIPGLPRAVVIESASVLIIVLWIAMGLVSLSLIFARTAMLEFRAVENVVAGRQAEAALLGAESYVKYILNTYVTNNALPDLLDYQYEAVPVGQASFWFLNRPDGDANELEPAFGLINEDGKLNINTATSEMLQRLPFMSAEFAASIVDWRDADEETSEGGGAESDYYQRLTPSYPCKNGPFESIEELWMVMGATEEILFGEDTNRNGILDANENDGDLSPPMDNKNGRLDRGILDFITVFSHPSTIEAGNTNLVNLNEAGRTALSGLLDETFGEDRRREILSSLGTANPRSVLEFYMRSGMSEEELEQIGSRLTVFTQEDEEVRTLVNANTAPVEVLQCIPGILTDYAAALVSARRNRNPVPTSLAWIKDVLPEQNAFEAGPYLTASGRVFAADIVATGRLGRGYRRVYLVFEKSEEGIAVVYRRDLSRLGFALGALVMEQILMDRQTMNL